MDKKQQVFRFLVENSGGVPPSVREICKALSIKSTSTVHGILHSLEEDGLIRIEKGTRRNISIVNSLETTKVPLLGTVAAGVPILAQENIEAYVSCDVKGDKDGLFALRVKGDSMKDAGIIDGDIIVARSARTSDNGDIVVVLLGEEATVKRLFRENGKIVLKAENRDFPAIYSDEVMVLGKVIACMRNYD
jgi:repressor LexA